MKYVRYADLKPRYGIPFSRTHIARLYKAGRFPPPVQLAPGTIAWEEEEILVYREPVRSERDASSQCGRAAGTPEAAMRRAPPNLGKTKGPPQRQLRSGPNRYQEQLYRNGAGRLRQEPADFPDLGRRSPSPHGMAKRLRDDGLAPIGVRTFALQVAHRLSVGGRLSLESERELRRLHTRRRRQLADALKLYR